MKLVFRLFLVLVLILVVGFVLILSYVDKAAKAGIETAMTDKLGVATTLDEISISLLSANCNMQSFKIANPPGYSTEPIFELGRGFVEVSANSLGSELIEIPRIELDGIRLRLEHKGSSGNYDSILERIGQGTGEKPKDDGKGRRFVVREVLIRDTQVVARIMPLGNVLPTPPVELKIPEIRLSDVGSEKPGGMTLSELGSQILGSVFVKVGDDVSGTLPQLIAQGLTSGIAGLPQLATITGDIDGGVSERIGSLLQGSGLGGSLRNATEGLDEGMKKADEAIKKGLGDLLGGNR